MLGINDGSVLNVVVDITQQQNGLPGGMGPKKGVKKLSKDEKIAILRAKRDYSDNRTDQQTQAQVAAIGGANYIAGQIAAMNYTQITALNTDLNNLTRNDVDMLVGAVAPHFVPQVAQWKQQIETLQAALRATNDALALAFTNEYHGVHTCDYDAFYDACANRQTNIQEQAQQDLQQGQQQLQQQQAQMQQNLQQQFDAEVQARVQAQIAAMQNQGGSSGSTDASMNPA